VEVAIRKFETQYRLPAGELAAARRLDQLRSYVLDDAFHLAVNEAGIGETAELCLRSLFVPVRLRLDASDKSITAAWSAALAREIGRVIRRGPTTNMVIYYSRRQALLDLALGVAHGDLGRAWAWRQLGLWRLSHAASERGAISELVSALEREPTMVVPTLQTLARLGWLPSLSTRMSPSDWEDLAGAALSESRAEHLLQGIAAGRSPRRAARGSLVREAWSVLNATCLLPAIAASAMRLATPDTRLAFAALAVMDADRGLLYRSIAPALIEFIAELFKSTPAEIRTALDQGMAEQTEPTVEHSRSDDHELKGPDDPVQDKWSEREMPSAHEATHATNQRELATPPARNARASPRSLESRPADFHEVAEPADAETDLIDLRRRSISRYAGLLFLIAIIEDLNLPEQILSDRILGARPFAWVLHQLALRLAPIGPRDPAALAFTGLAPDAKSPAESEAPPTDEELSRLNYLALQITERLSSLLGLDEQTEISPMEFVTRRRGEIVTDPGWLEVRFSLDDVTTEIRRAGLDLNPGYVPWLGLVVMFFYD
jgi:hypothetical protein